MGRPAVAEQRREQILEGLFAAIAKKGFARCSISDVAAESGLARGALHYYFESKEHMLTELMRSLGQQHVDGLRSYRSRFTHPMERILAIFRFHFAPGSEQHSDRARVWIEYWGYGLDCDKVRGVIRDIQQDIRDMLEKDLRAGVDAGIFQPMPIQAVAVAILGMVEGPMLQKTYDPGGLQGAAILEASRHMLEASLLKSTNPGG